MKVAITGATGFVGSRLTAELVKTGHAVVVLTRSPDAAQTLFPPAAFPNLEIVAYNPVTSGDWQSRLSGCEAVVNLAGASLTEQRWTPARKQEISASRILGTQKLVAAIAQADPKPQILVNASAIGYYGFSETATFTESDPPGDDFLGKLCQQWESAAQQVQAHGVRLVVLRLGIVLGNGGAIAKMIPVFRLFAGGPIGSGQQWFSWIHREDVVRLIIKSLQNPQLQGVYNATAPHPLRMAEFCHVLGKAMNRPSWLPVPKFALETLLGDGAVVMLEGQQVLPKALAAIGFNFQYPTAQGAIEEVLSHY
ncbi:MAG: TIGR01777 family oxidoreductase [Cyanobacteria bacterium P01_G01_bin.54]